MKKNVLIAGALLAIVSLTGCQASLGLENDNVKITQYKKIEINKVADAMEVDDDTVESTINATLAQNATKKDVTDRAVKEGDTANIDFVGKMNGKEFEGGSSKGYDLEIGSHSFIDGFEESIIGHKIGDKFDWKGKFPKDYGSEELAGKDVVFTITVNSIVETEVPELTDEFVQSVSETSKTVDEYKAEVRKQLEDDAKKTHDDNMTQEIWDKILENTEVIKYPKKDVQLYVDQINSTYEKYAEYYGLKFDDFIEQQMGMSKEDYDKEITKAAESSVKKDLATAAIAEKESIVLDDATYQTKLEEMAESYGYADVDALLEDVGESYEPILKKMILNELVSDWLVENCIQVEK